MIINIAPRKHGITKAQRKRAESLRALGFRTWTLELPAGITANADDMVMYQRYGMLEQWVVISRNGLIKQRKTI